MIDNTTYDLPAPDLLAQQAEWLAPARSRLLRQVGIAHRRCVLDLGAGYGAVTGELARRSGGAVVALDRAIHALRADATPFAGAHRVGGDAALLAVSPDGAFDLVFTQLTLLWVSPLERALDEIARILAPGGALVALGAGLRRADRTSARNRRARFVDRRITRAGADPYIGRKLPEMLAARGFSVNVGLFDTLYAPSPARFDFLRDLPLTEAERATLEHIEQEALVRRSPWSQVAHLPFFLVTAIKSQ